MLTIDQAIINIDLALSTLFAKAQSEREHPGAELPEASLSDEERAQSAALMRINHVGEVCAQALYQGQAITCADQAIKNSLAGAAREETEHLAWTEERINALGGRKSYLNPLWYGGALAIGMIAGKMGNSWNLGFLCETEKQVENHLASHQAIIASKDLKSQAVLQQMKEDEVKHAAMAEQLGAQELPPLVKLAMRAAAKVMTTVAHKI